MRLETKAKDKITGFTGVITRVVEYISGCNQALLTPPISTDGKLQDARWFDLQRIKLLEDKPSIVLDNSETPGPDMPAPVR